MVMGFAARRTPVRIFHGGTIFRPRLMILHRGPARPPTSVAVPRHPATTGALDAGGKNLVERQAR
jgi:hypothetical protein